MRPAERRRSTITERRSRAYLKASVYAEAGEQLVTATVIEAAATMSDPADLINRAIEALSKAAIDLPAFSTLDRLANHLRTEVHMSTIALSDGSLIAAFDGLPASASRVL